MRLVLAFVILLTSCARPETEGTVKATADARNVSVTEPEAPKPAVKPPKSLKSVYEAEIGVREKTGNNDGERVEEYLRSVNLKRGNPWCAAFVKWCFDEAGVKTRVTGGSWTCYDKSRVTWERKWKGDFAPGQVFTLYYPALGRIGHTGFADAVDGGTVTTVEGNSNDGGSREGIGVFRRKRPLKSLKAICEFR